MTLSRKSWENYIMTLRDINEEAALKLVQYQNTHNIFSGTIDEITVNDEELKPFIDYAYAIVSKYGEASASLAAEMYDLTAELEGVILPPAELPELAKYGDVAKAINGTIKTSQNADEIAGAATRWVKMAASDTTLHNAMRDGAQFAWIPFGDTCPFCLMLASRGWQYMSKKALKGGHAEHIHSNCDCQYTIRHDPRMTVSGYDPDKYLSMYRNAEGQTPTDRINYMRRELYAEARANDSELFDVTPNNTGIKIDIPQNIREELDNLESKYYDAKAERYFAIDEEGELIFDSGRGGSRSVSVPKSVDERMEGGYSYHNHTADATFSPADISNYEKYGEHGFITTIKGEEHILYNTNPVSKYKEVEQAARDNESRYAELMPFSVAANTFYREVEETYAEARRAFSRELVRTEQNTSIRAIRLNEWIENNPGPDSQMIDWLKENARKYGFIFQINPIKK